MDDYECINKLIDHLIDVIDREDSRYDAYILCIDYIDQYIADLRDGGYGFGGSL